MYPKGQVLTGVPKNAKERTEWLIPGPWPSKCRPTDASFDGYSGPTAIISQYVSPLLNPTCVHVNRFARTRLLGPETGWSNGQEEYMARWLMLDVVLLICRTA